MLEMVKDDLSFFTADTMPMLLPRNSLETSSVISLPSSECSFSSIDSDSDATVPEDDPPTESQDIGCVDALSPQSEVDSPTESQDKDVLSKQSEVDSPTESQDKDALSPQSEPATTASRKRVRYTSLEAEEPEAKQRKTDSTESAADALFRELEIQSYQSYQEWK